jgi:hypothetical protein
MGCFLVRVSIELFQGKSIWRNLMQRSVTGFYQDEEEHWAARLECGHGLHVRHDPPWQVRKWVTTEAGRAARIGRLMECKRCDEEQMALQSTR